MLASGPVVPRILYGYSAINSCFGHFFETVEIVSIPKNVPAFVAAILFMVGIIVGILIGASGGSKQSITTAKPTPGSEPAYARRGLPVNMLALTPEERRQRVIGGGQVIWQSGDERIVEANYLNGQPREWVRERKFGKGWERHGLEVYWKDTGEYQELTRDRGETEGEVRYYSADGKLQRIGHFSHGAMID